MNYSAFSAQMLIHEVNPLDSKGNYSATSNNTKLVHWPLMGGLLHLVQRGKAPPSPLLAVPNVTAHQSTASVPITVRSVDLWFNVAIKGLLSKWQFRSLLIDIAML